MGHSSIYSPEELRLSVRQEGTSEAGDFLLEFASAAGTELGDTALSGMTETPGAGESYSIRLVTVWFFRLLVNSCGFGVDCVERH
jgi:hypothetical protein